MKLNTHLFFISTTWKVSLLKYTTGANSMQYENWKSDMHLIIYSFPKMYIKICNLRKIA